jgi:hypothetical protein
MMTKRNRQSADGNYKVGYGKPPEETRFKAGQSGNPAGRPVGRKSARAIFEEVLLEPREVRLGGTRAMVTSIEALFRDMRARAFRGDARARADLLKLAEKHGLLDEKEPDIERVIEIHIGFHGPEPGYSEEQRQPRTISQENDPPRLLPPPTMSDERPSNQSIVRPAITRDEDWD